MSKTDYLTDQKLSELVKDVLVIGRQKRAHVLKDFQKNVIDPFAALIDSAVTEVDHQTWKNAEMVRQCQKTLTNHIGNLHQKVLASIDGWEDLETGAVVDLVCHHKKIIAEVKNKHNTVTGGKLADQYHSLDRLVMRKTSIYKGYTAYFVNIIPKKPQRFDKPFTPSDKETGSKCPTNEKIRIIDGASFYSLVTGNEHALKNLYNALPSVIERIYRTEFKQPHFTISDKEAFATYYAQAYEK